MSASVVLLYTRYTRASIVPDQQRCRVACTNCLYEYKVVSLSSIHSLGVGPLQASNRYKMQLQGLEDQLLQRLADAPADILADVALIEVGAR